MPESPEQTAYELQLAALKQSLQTMVQAVIDVKQGAKLAENALKLNGMTYEEIVESIVGATSMTIADLAEEFNTFKAREDNPHNVTKDQIGLGLVENLATKFVGDINELKDGDLKDIDDHTVTVAGAYWLAEKAILQISNTAPETLDTINEIAEALQNNPDIISIIQEQVNTKATKAELAAAIESLTRESVGLDKVENFAPATVEEAMDAERDDLYMTPKTTHVVVDDLRDDFIAMMADLSDEFNEGAALIQAAGNEDLDGEED